MEPKYVFIDESGDPNLNEKASSHFIISAVIVSKSEIDTFNKELDNVIKRFFPNGELKSNKIGVKFNRRERILKEIQPINFNSIALVIDKAKIYKDCGLSYKKSFYKYVHDKLYKELKRAFSDITIIVDEFGTNEFKIEFKQYVFDKIKPNLFDNFFFTFENSKNTLGIQLADLISGSLSYEYEVNKKNIEGKPNFRDLLKSKISRIDFFPSSSINLYEEYNFDSKYDELIANTSLLQANIVIDNLESDELENKECIILAKYLRYLLVNFDYEGYVSTKILKSHLASYFGKEYNDQVFRGYLAHLKDLGMLISSTSKGGYKLPSSLKDIDSFINIGNNQVIPMIKRIDKCRKLISTVTDNKIDILDKSKYSTLKNMLDNDVV